MERRSNAKEGTETQIEMRHMPKRRRNTKKRSCVNPNA